MSSSIKPEDKPKVYGLAGAIAIVFVVGGFNILRSVLPGAPAPTPATTPSASAANATPGSSPTPGASGTPEIPGAMYVPRPRMPVDKLAILQPNFGADPFRPIVPVKTAPEPVLQNTLGSPPAIITQVPNSQYAALYPRLPISAAPVLPAPVIAPLKLTGVVAGPDAVAMIGDGASQHFLHRGDVIQGYHIVKIDEDAVTLRRANAGKVLRVGADGAEMITFSPTPAVPTKSAAVKTSVTSPAPSTKVAFAKAAVSTPSAANKPSAKAPIAKPAAPGIKTKAVADHSHAPGARGTATSTPLTASAAKSSGTTRKATVAIAAQVLPKTSLHPVAVAHGAAPQPKPEPAVGSETKGR